MEMGDFEKLRRKIGLKFDPQAAEYLISVIDYLLKELIDSSCNLALAKNKKELDPKSILNSIKEDNEFYQILKNVSFKKTHQKPLNDIKLN